MDIIDGELYLDDAYEQRFGAWDKVTIAYGYQDFPDNVDEIKALNELLEQAHSSGSVCFLNDAHDQRRVINNGTYGLYGQDHHRSTGL